MANKHTLHRNHIPDFLKWLEANDWEILVPKGYYEVIRATHPRRQHPLLIYTSLRDPAHYTVRDRDMPVIWRFLKERREQNAKRKTDL